MNLKDKATYFYIKNIKKWMFCPNCYANQHNAKMKVDRKNDNWVCSDCGYTLSCKKYESGITFWFCDGCGTYLNKQNGFTEKNKRWVCTKCGFDNDVTEANIRNKCCGCGKEMPQSYKPLYCPECKQKRLEKVIEILKLTSEICYTISDSLKEIDDIPRYSNGMPVNEYLADIDDIYEDSDIDTKTQIDQAIFRSTGKRISAINNNATACGNCGNVDSRTLFDEGDTIYCQKCCHRTRKSDGKDDLMICPVCHHLKDRKSMYCQWCNNSDPSAKYSPEAESLANEFEAKLTPDNIRYYNLKGKRKI